MDIMIFNELSKLAFYIFANTSKNEFENDNLDIIHGNVKYMKELMAHNDILEYCVTNNVEAIMDILKKYEILDSKPDTPLSFDSLF